MSDFEMLSIMIMILSIIVTLLIALFNQSKKQSPVLRKLAITLFDNQYV